MHVRNVVLGLVLAFSSAVCLAQADRNPAALNLAFQTIQVAEGIYLFSPPTGGSFVNGNSVLVIGTDRSLVVDSAHFPSMTRAMIAEVRKLTGSPVQFLVNTHWHADHNSGNSVYRDAFPNLTIISTDPTRDKIAHFPEEADDVKQVQGFLPSAEKTLAGGVGRDGKPLSPQSRAGLQRMIDLCRAVLPEFESIRRLPPNVTFSDAITIDLGGRIVKVAFLGRGNTAGDAVIYVPDAKVVATGDLVVAPVPYGFGSFVSEWADTLTKLQQFDAAVIIPGHGLPMHDWTYVSQLTALLRDMSRQVNAAVARGETDEQIGKSVDLSRAVHAITGGDARLEQEIADFFLSSALPRAIQEARKGKDSL